MRWLLEYGERDRHLETIALLTFALLALLYYVLASGVVGATQTQDQIAGSQYVPDILLALFRTVAAVLSVFTLISICTDDEGSLSLPTLYDSRQSEEVLLLGIHRLVPFTVWSFAAFGLYFSVAAASSWVLVLGGEVPGWALAAVPLAFATATVKPEGTPTPEISAEAFYKQEVNRIALQVSNDLGRVIRLLSSPNVENMIWVNDIRQTSAALARYSARADDLAIPEGQEELQETLTNVLNDLARAGRLVINSLDAVGFQNVSVAQQDILDARDTLSVASPIIVDIVSQTADERE